jgi:uncharacterized protein YidB (DUF937 family)
METMMGLFDQLAGQVLGAVGGQPAQGTQGALISGVMAMIASNGGLPAVLQKLKDSGLQDHVASWIGSGENKPVSADQISNALGSDNVAQVAEHAGIPPDQAAQSLAQMLPQLIDHLTPNGQVPEGDLMQQGLSLLKGKLFG